MLGEGMVGCLTENVRDFTLYRGPGLGHEGLKGTKKAWIDFRWSGVERTIMRRDPRWSIEVVGMLLR